MNRFTHVNTFIRCIQSLPWGDLRSRRTVSRQCGNLCETGTHKKYDTNGGPQCFLGIKSFIELRTQWAEARRSVEMESTAFRKPFEHVVTARNETERGCVIAVLFLS